MGGAFLSRDEKTTYRHRHNKVARIFGQADDSETAFKETDRLKGQIKVYKGFRS